MKYKNQTAKNRNQTSETKNKEKIMNHLKTNHSYSSRYLPVRIMLAALAMLALASIPVTRASEDNRAPDLPSALCDRLQVRSGNKVAFHVYALGVQIYRWNGTSWGLWRQRRDCSPTPNTMGK